MISTTLNPTQSIWNSSIPFWQTISTFFLWQSVCKVVYAVQKQLRECRKLLTNGQRPLYFLEHAIPGVIYLRFYRPVKSRVMYADGLYHSMIDDKDVHILSPLIILTCTALCQALLESQKNKGVHPKASKSKMKANRPDCSNYVNYKNDLGNIASCCAATGRKLITLPRTLDT
jgi:hypothetical protein